MEPYPANFLVRTRLPQLQILEKADVFVTHGGMNSVQEGLYYEVPVIVVPQQIEQSINGRRIAELGAGIVLGDAPPYGRVSVDQLRDALDRVLADPAYRSRAAELGAGARAAGGYLRGADEVEGVLARATAPRD
ncbi:MAG: nucleotide disphospho-sugar-binding domain-containing protein [Marmoricola sp.]